jgi:cytochrome c-type biogenesis protein CcmF
VSVILSGIAFYVITGSFVDLGMRIFGGDRVVSSIAQRILGLPRHAFGTAFAHAGIGVTLLGLAATGWGSEKVTTLKAGDKVEIDPYQLTFENITPATVQIIANSSAASPSSRMERWSPRSNHRHAFTRCAA